MAFELVADVFNHSKTKGLDRLVLLAIANFAHAKTGKCFPSISSIAGKCGITDRTVQRCITRIKGLGELSIIPGGTFDGKLRANEYRITLTGCTPYTGGTSDTGTSVNGTLEPVSNSHPNKEYQSRRNKESGAAAQSSLFTNPILDRIPNNLRTDEFLDYWKRWQQHLLEIKRKLTRQQEIESLKRLSAWGPERAVEALKHTIAQGWQGIREPDHKAVGGQSDARDFVF
jgi:helix-turn-helix protein